MVTAWLLGAVLVWSVTVPCCLGLRIAWLAPGPGSSNKINSDTSVAALKLALRSVEKTSRGSGKNVGIKYFETACTSQAATASMFAQRAYSPDVIIGPPCKPAMKSVAQLAGFWNVPVFGWYNPDIEFDDVKDYPTLIRMVPSANIMAQSLIHLMRQNGWRRFVLLHDSDHMGLAVKDALVHGVAMTTDVRMFSTKRLDDAATSVQLMAMFNSIKQHATIIVFACSGHSVRRYMLAANKVGMTTGQYVFIQLDYEIYSGSQLRNSLLSDGGWRRGDRDDDDARRAYETLIHIVLDPMADDGNTTRDLPKSRYEEFSQLALKGADLTKPRWQLPVSSKNIDSLFPSQGAAVRPDVYSLYLYDAVVVWSVLVDVLNRSGIDHRKGQMLAGMAKSFYADGATGFIQVNENLDRVGKVFILDMGYDGNFKPVQVLRFNTTNGYSAKNLVPIKHMFRWSSHRRGLQQTPSDIPPIPTGAIVKKVIRTTTTTTTRRPTTTTTSTTPRPITTPTPTTTTAKPDPMNLIMNRLAALERFLTKPDPVAKPPQHNPIKPSGPATMVPTPKPNNNPRQRNRAKNGRLKALTDSFADNAQSGKRGRKRKGGRRRGKKTEPPVQEVEVDPPRRLMRRKRPPTTTLAPWGEPTVDNTGVLAADWYDNTTAPADFVTPPPAYSAALDRLFGTAVEGNTNNLPKRANKGPNVGRPRVAGPNKRTKQRQFKVQKQNPLPAKTDQNVLKGNNIQPINGAQSSASNTGIQPGIGAQPLGAQPLGAQPLVNHDALIDQISAKVAARISHSISKKLTAAKETIKKNDKNYAVHIIGDWIPGHGEDGMQKLNMTVKVDKTNNKDLKVTAQGLTVDNTINQKTIDTAKNKTTHVTIEPPAEGEKGKRQRRKGRKHKLNTSTTPATQDVLTVTVAPPHPPMYHPPWPPYPMYPASDPSAWQQSGESEQPQQPQYAYPPPYPHYPYPYPHHGAQQQESSSSQEGGNTPYPPYPPPGYPPYPMYPYPGQWGQQSNSEV